MDNRCIIKAIQVGGLAMDVLSPGAQGSVIGVTSSGIFLNSSNMILFITENQYNSPYNIQVEAIAQLTSHISVGDVWSVEGEKIILERIHFQIDIQTSQIWKPSPLKNVDNPKFEQIKRMDVLLDRLYELDPDKGWLFLRDADKGSRLEKFDIEAQRIHNLTGLFLSNVRRSDLAACLASSSPILGLGAGLTPSGDDWLTGFFLYFARQGCQDQFLLELGSAISTIAMERTTKISANRIKAACQGWAEEIFLEVLDHLLVSSVELLDEEVQRLVNFGHSSGVDTCMGIFSALSLL